MCRCLMLLMLLSVPWSLGAVSSPRETPCNLVTNGLAQQGCCSWHGGICGCMLGRVQCCDGAASPTCRCHEGTESDAEVQMDEPLMAVTGQGA